MNDRLDELLNDEIDGLNGPAECRELDARLRQDPAARLRRQELHESLGLLERLGTVEPPAGLRGRIEAALATVPAPAAAGPSRAKATLRLRGGLGWSRRPSTALAFAAGIVLAVIGIALVRQIEIGPQPAPRDLLGLVRPADAPVGGTFAGPGFQGTLRAGWQHGRAVLSLDLQAERPVDVTVQAEDGVCSGWLGAAPPAARVEITGGRVELRGLPSGTCDLLFLPAGAGPVVLHTRAGVDGTTFAEVTLTVDRQGRD